MGLRKGLRTKEQAVVLAKGYYEVKKVLKKRIVNCRTEWFVQWKGYAKFHNEWIYSLPDAFQSEWGPVSDQDFVPPASFTALVELAASIGNGDVKMNSM
jgi:hypothetical protein